MSNLLKKLLIQTSPETAPEESSLAGALIKASTGETFEAHSTSADKHLTEAEKGYLSKAGTAGGVPVLDATGHLPSGVYDSTKMPVETTVSTIAARNALTGLADGAKVFVEDASGDASVSAGWAIYRYHTAVGETPAGWTKLAEAESLDLIHDWDNIQNKPVSDADMTDSVSKKHTHANQTGVLDKLTAQNGSLLYDGKGIGTARVVTSPEEATAAKAPVGTLFFVVEKGA